MEKSKETLLKKAYELGFNYEREYGGCCQCVLAAIQDTLDMRNDALFKAGTGFAGGMGVTGVGPCGALSGGVMAISSQIGRERQNIKDPERIRWTAYDLTKKLYEKFVEEYGGGTCKEIQKKLFGRSFNLRDPNEYKEYEKAGGHATKCPSVVGNAAKWTVEILWSNSNSHLAEISSTI